jgi:PQQ-dependent catabolism-associated CXXCW motif protein
MKLPLFLFVILLGACTTVPLPDGYRMNRYKAPVPNYAPGAQTINAEQAFILKNQGALFIDVIGSGKYLTKGVDGHWISVKPHDSIPDSYWLPNVGRGALTPDQLVYFKNALLNLTRQDKTAKLVFFCLKSCWMSWNAAKRAARLGYQSVYWLADGKDGWKDAGYNLSNITPFLIEN